MSLIFDLRYALRLLKKSPSFTVLSILVLAGGLAVSLFTFAFLYTFTSKPLPLAEQDSLYRASLFWYSEAAGEHRYLPAYEAAKIRSQAKVFTEHGIWQNKTVYLSLGDNNLVTSAARTSANLFKISRTSPLLGRALEPSDSDDGQPPVVVISYAIWQSQFAGRDTVIGSQVYINDVLTEIIGVMPKGYRFPISHDLWLPISQKILNPLATDHEKVELLARLKPNISEAQAETQLNEIAKNSFNSRANLWPDVELISAKVGSFQQFDVVTEMKIFSFALNLIALFILMLAAINVGNLLFARAIQRNKESAIRAALGAPQWRLVSQLMWEGIIITVAGTLIALGVVGTALKMVNVYFHSLMHDELPFWYIWELDATTLIAASGFAITTIVIGCFLPALKAVRQDFNSVLRDGTRGAQSKQVGRLSRFLITLQISTISIIMVLGIVISMKVHHLTNIQLGYDVSGIYFSIIDLPDHRYPKDRDKAHFFSKLQTDLANNNIFAGVSTRFNFRQQTLAIDGIEYATDADKPKVQIYSLIGAPEFMGPTLISGRHLDARDAVGRAATAVISGSMAQRYWPEDSPINKRIEISIEGNKHQFHIVGVVFNTSNNPFEKIETFDEVYLSGYQFPAQRGTLFFEKSATANSLVEDAFFKTINRIDTQLNILTIEDWEMETSAIAKMTVTFRDTIIVSGLFSLILAISGIYGLTAFSVEKRSHEVGIRCALGATDARIIMLFVIQGSRQLVIGLIVGLMISGLILFAISNIIGLSGLVYSAIYLSVVVSLWGIVIAAILIPARRAVHLQPAIALRDE